MALFDFGKKVKVSAKKVRPTVVKTENVAKEIASIIADFTQIALTLVILINTSSGG